MNQNTFQNPLLSGFYPDPSIVRVEEDYYMVNSSFVYYPGLPIFHSRDLVHWTQIGHGIHRPKQLDYKNCETSLGLWAPSIRYYQGTYYIINTFVSEGREARRDNYIITAQDPAGPWSDPVFIEGADGIDSSLFFDDDGRIYYTGNYICDPCLYEGHHGIYLQELNPNTLQFTGNRTILWDGIQTRSKWIEAPHLYKKDGYYYLMVAEGGTFTNHSVSMARCQTIDGTYAICPRNPIVSHRHLSLQREISVVGHADLVETQNGEWWMVLLGVRPYANGHYNLGRETFLAPIVWESDGWPRIDNASGLIQSEERLPALPACHYAVSSFSDHFDSDALSMIWNTIHPPVNPFYSLTERTGYLRLFLKEETLHEIGTPAFLGRRQEHDCFQATAALTYHFTQPGEQCGIALVQDDRYHYVFALCSEENSCHLQLWETRKGQPSLLQDMPLEDSANRIYLTVQGYGTGYDFYYGMTEHTYIPFYQNADATLLSTLSNQGFTGAYLGMYGTSNHQATTDYADYDYFHYQPLPR